MAPQKKYLHEPLSSTAHNSVPLMSAPDGLNISLFQNILITRSTHVHNQDYTAFFNLISCNLVDVRVSIHVPENCSLNIYRCDNSKSHVFNHFSILPQFHITLTSLSSRTTESSQQLRQPSSGFQLFAK